MADLLTPKTWTSGEVPTASSMNSGIRDPINRLNGFADTITEATAADSGEGVRLNIVRPAVNNIAFSTHASSDSELEPMFEVTAGGQLRWGPGDEDTSMWLERENTVYMRSNFGLLVKPEAVAGGQTAMAIFRPGDNVGRVGVSMNASGDGYIGFSSDGNDVDAQLRQGIVNELIFDNPDNDASAPIVYTQGSTTGLKFGFAWRRTGDSSPRIAIGQESTGTGAIWFGSGSSSPDIAINRGGTGRIGINGMLNVANGVATRVNAGAFSNVVWDGGSGGAAAVDGLMGIDSSNGRLYIRYGGAHHYIAQTAGFVIPESERACPQCDGDIVIGERVVGRINAYQEDDARHGLWEHDQCPS